VRLYLSMQPALCHLSLDNFPVSLSGVLQLECYDTILT
jgi:hypothetical protein